MVVQPEKIDFRRLCNDLIKYVLNISVLIQCVHFKTQLNSSGLFYEELRFNTICNITQEPRGLQRYNRACRFIGKSAVIKCHQLLSKVTSVIYNRRSLVGQ